MHFDNSKQFFKNESLLACLGVNTRAYYSSTSKEVEEEIGICTQCGEFVPMEELKSDCVCDHCFREFYIKGTVNEKTN